MTDIFVSSKNNKKSIIIGGDGSNMNILTSFCKDPKGISFQTQKHDEIIVLFLRAHFITTLNWIAITLILIAVPMVIAILSSIFDIRFFSTQLVRHFTAIYVLFYYLIVFAYIFINFLHWFYNVFIVTSERVVDIDYSDIVIHNIAVTKLSHVQDVNYTQSGFIPTFFNYGNLFVQTAGTEINFEAPNVPKPREATHIIGDLIGKA